MTASYAADNASALADLTSAGARVTFTVTSPGTYDGTTNTWSTPVTTTVTGAAIRDKGDPLTYERLNLIPTEAPTLFFAPDTYGAVPTLDMSVTWGGQTYMVRDVDPIAPSGTALAAYVVVSR